jgi:hypothetical protein
MSRIIVSIVDSHESLWQRLGCSRGFAGDPLAAANLRPRPAGFPEEPPGFGEGLPESGQGEPEAGRGRPGQGGGRRGSG